MMKYTIEYFKKGEIKHYIPDLLRNKAIAEAIRLKTEDPGLVVFITFFRKRDGQYGYLNPDRHHAIVAESW